MARRKRIPYDPPGSRGKGKKRRRAIPRAEHLFMSRRMFLARGAVIGAFAVLAGRLGFMQMVKSADYKQRAEKSVQDWVTTPATRGMIYDRAGRELAKNRRAWEVRIDPAKLPDEGTPERAAVLDQLINALGLPDALILNPRDVPAGDEAMVYAKTAQMLGKATLGVEATERTVRREGVLGPDGRVLLVNGEEMHVFAYPTAVARAEETARIGLDGNLLDGTRVEWGGVPNLMPAGNLLTVLLCQDVRLIDSVKRAIGRLPSGKAVSSLTFDDVVNELQRAGLASWTEYIEQEKRFSRLVRLEDELTVDQAALFRSRLHELPGVKVVNQLEYRIANSPGGRTVVVKTGVPKAIALKLEANTLYLPGVELDGNALVREYPGGESMSHILGYAGRISLEELEDPENRNAAGNKIYEPDDTIGKDGLERVMEPALRGERGGRWVEVDAAGLERHTLEMVPPVSGQNVALTIDLEFQRAVAEILRLGIEFSNADRQAIAARNPDKPLNVSSGAGCVVAIDPRNGEVLAMVSFPHYDNQLFVDGISSRKFREYTSKERNKPLLDRALRGAYPPGSTLKPFLAAAALEEGTVTPGTTYTCGGGIIVPFAWNQAQGTAHPCWLLEPGHGALDIQGAIERSCDVFFYNVGAPRQPLDENNPNSDYLHYRDYNPVSKQVGEKHYFEGLGIERINEHLEKRFWFGQRTGIELPTEEPGVVPDPAWLRDTDPEANWSASATINVSIGQGYFLTTPLQLAVNTAALANRGNVPKPRLVREITGGEEGASEPTKPEVLRALRLSPEHMVQVREGMRRVIGALDRLSRETTGATKWAMANPEGEPEIPLAGKTGTAEVGLRDEVTGVYQSQHAWFTCFAPYDEPEIAVVVILEDGGEGANYAVPVADRVLRAYFELTGKRPRGLVLRPDGATAAPDAPVLADRAAFPTPGGTSVEAVD